GADDLPLSRPPDPATVWRYCRPDRRRSRSDPAGARPFALTGLGPALGKRQRAGAEGSSFALPRPWSAPRLDAVSCQAGAEGRDQESAYPIRTTGLRVGLGVNEQWIADLIPGQRNLLVPGDHPFGPEIARIPRFRELGIEHRDCRVSGFGVEHSLDGGLQPSRHRNVIGVDVPAIIRQLAVEVENVPWSGRASDDAPKARIRRVGTAVGLAQAYKRVLPGQDHTIRVGGHRRYLPWRVVGINAKA